MFDFSLKLHVHPFTHSLKRSPVFVYAGSHGFQKKPKDFIENAKNADYLGVEPRCLFPSIFRQNTADIVKANIGRLELLPKECLKRLGLDYLESQGVKSPRRHGRRAPRYSRWVLIFVSTTCCCVFAIFHLQSALNEIRLRLYISS